MKIKLKVKDLDLYTGNTVVAALSMDDAKMLDLHPEDRIHLKKGRRKTIAIVDVAQTNKSIRKGYIGLFEESLAAIKAKQGDMVEISIMGKPESVHYIRQKMDGKKLGETEIRAITKDVVAGRLSSVEMTYFVSACYNHGLDARETAALTRAIVSFGDVLKRQGYPVLDKHSIGGVPGNRTTMVVVPIVAAAGFLMPKTSSRSITSPSGTADTMEVLAPVTLGVRKMRSVVRNNGACIVWGGAINLASADDKLIKIRHPLSLDPEGMLLASILAKKHAVSATHVLVDIPIGPGAKILERSRAIHLKRRFEGLAKALGMNLKTIITDGSQPIGNGIGPALECIDVIKVLEQHENRPMDLEKKSIFMASKILTLSGKMNYQSAKKMAVDLLVSGKAAAKFWDIVEAQGGKARAIGQIKLSDLTKDVKAAKGGRVRSINNISISRIARIAGAPVDTGSGIYLHKHVGDKVAKGDSLITIYSCHKEKLKFALNAYRYDNPIKI